MGDNLVPNGVVEGLQGFLLQIEVSQIVVHEADEPNAVVDLFDAKLLSGQHSGEIDPLRHRGLRTHRRRIDAVTVH
jgi:hypothetical protein